MQFAFAQIILASTFSHLFTVVIVCVHAGGYSSFYNYNLKFVAHGSYSRQLS